MEIRLQKWGNSNGIRIPSTFLNSLKIKTNDRINIEQINDKIILSKVKKPKVSLKELFNSYRGEKLSKDFEWDEPQGKEIW